MTMQGEELKELRVAAGLSQAELGEAIGMARETIGAMERGAHNIELRTELAIRYVATPLIPVKRELDVQAKTAERVAEQTAAAIFGQGPAATMSIAEIAKALFPLLDKRYQTKSA